MERKSNFLRYTLWSLFLILFGWIVAASADEVATSDGKHYEGIIVNQSPSSVTLRTKDGTITLRRSDLKYIKKWSKDENKDLTAKWSGSSEASGDSQACDEELKFADSVRYSDKPWEIYEEDAFIAFHHGDTIIKSRLKGKVGDYCKKIADKFGYEEFKLYDKEVSPDWGLKFKFYSYRDFHSWKKILESKGKDPARVIAFAIGDRRLFFSEGYLTEDVIYHEIAHDIYHDFTKNAAVPLWWDEGIAQYALLTSNEAREHISRSRFRALNNKQISLLSADDSYDHIYGDGLSVVYFLIREKGKDKFKEFNYSLRKGKKFGDSLSEVYGFKDTNALEKAWVEYLKKTDVKDMVGD